MAWRCTNCGRVFEGKHYPLGNNCPDGEYGKHIWIPFESALDKQNKLLEEQNRILSEQILKQNSPSVEEKPQKPRFVISDALLESNRKVEDEYSDAIIKYLGWENIKSSMKGSMKWHVAHQLFDTFSGITCFSPLQIKKGSGRYDLIWTFSRDTRYRKEGIVTCMFMTETEIGKECESLTNYYGISYKVTCDDSTFTEYLEAFKASSLFQLIQSKSKHENYYFGQSRYSFYPKKYCESLDEIMMKQDGKREWYSFLKRYKKARLKSIIVTGFLVALAAIILFLFGKCTIGCFLL